MKCPCCNGTGEVERLPKRTRGAADSIIETYYHRKAAGSKVTLKQLAQQHGYNYSYLSQVKRQYDDAGKWGSKPL